jgi:hypothetical protein
MKKALLLIICCLVFALSIRNTCPYGAAGKSIIVAGYGHQAGGMTSAAAVQEK